MTKGKVYGSAKSFRTQKVLATAKLAGQDVEIAGEHPPKGKFALNYTPAFESGDVHVVGEIAIARHLLGEKASAEVYQWAEYGVSHLQPSVLAYVLPSISAAHVDAHTLEVAHKEFSAKLRELDVILEDRTFLVGERLSFADIAVAFDVLPAFQYGLGSKCRENLVNLTRWFNTVIHQAAVKAVVGEVKFPNEPSKFDQASFNKLKSAGGHGGHHGGHGHGHRQEKPKKEENKKEEKPKKEEKKKPAKEEEEDEPATLEEKFVDPFAKMPPGKFNMDAWKRVYSNEDTATKAIPYFWENFDPENYSIWYGEYKYPEDLTLTFMSCNLITGMFQRLDKMRKNAFGSVALFGDNNASTISGVWVWRGHDLAFELSPDWQVDYESYEWKKLDPNDEKTKQLVNEYWLWEGGFDGKKFNQGKIFK